MRLQKVYILKSRGFTFFELLISIAIFIFVIASSIPITVSFYQRRALDVHLNEIVQALRKAQLKSMAIYSDSSFGVYIGSSSYIIFKGDSFQNRDSVFDEVFNLPNNILVSGLQEIVFSKLSGIPSQSGDIILTFNNQTKIITINEVGIINY